MKLEKKTHIGVMKALHKRGNGFASVEWARHSSWKSLYFEVKGLSHRNAISALDKLEAGGLIERRPERSIAKGDHEVYSITLAGAEALAPFLEADRLETAKRLRNIQIAEARHIAYWGRKRIEEAEGANYPQEVIDDWLQVKIAGDRLLDRLKAIEVK